MLKAGIFHYIASLRIQIMKLEKLRTEESKKFITKEAKVNLFCERAKRKEKPNKQNKRREEIC